MIKLFMNPTFQKAACRAAVNIVKVGVLTVASVWLSRTTHKEGSEALLDMAQHYRLVKHEMSSMEGS